MNEWKKLSWKSSCWSSFVWDLHLLSWSCCFCMCFCTYRSFRLGSPNQSYLFRNSNLQLKFFSLHMWILLTKEKFSAWDVVIPHNYFNYRWHQICFFMSHLVTLTSLKGRDPFLLIVVSLVLREHKAMYIKGI